VRSAAEEFNDRLAATRPGPRRWPTRRWPRSTAPACGPSCPTPSRYWQRPGHGWDSLTPTEREVAQLVAEGLSNPGVADRLFISRATVKTHLTHVFTKLDITNRAQLTALVTRATAESTRSRG
jgi:DNA-binding CsgD family transcriptional regulator